jgi:5-methylthioadenosine/S-adenosylhomocysteine deaminase
MLLCAGYVVPVTSDPIVDGAVLVRNGRIRDIGSSEMLRLRYPDEETRDYGQAVLLPGFVDLHTHLENSVMRGMVHDVPYAQWLLAVNEISARMSTHDWNESAVLGGLEALSSGITCIADITSTGASLRAAQKLGLRGVIYREVTAMDKSRVDAAIHLAADDIESWSEAVDSDRLLVGIAPAPLFSCHPLVLKRVAKYAGDDLPVAMHLAGSREESNFIQYGSSTFSVHNMQGKRGYVEVPPWLPTGTSPVQYALNWDAFKPAHVLAIHCVHVDEDDINTLKQNNVSIAVCPRCNAQLGMGVAPMSEFLDQGFAVGIGSDSPAATNSTDMLIEMRNAMLVQRAINVKFLSSQAVLEAATIGGARAIHLDDQIGSLEIGKMADIIAIDISSSHQMPTTDPVSAVVGTTSGSDVVMSMVGGTIRYEQNRWHVDVEVAKNIATIIGIRGKLRR